MKNLIVGFLFLFSIDVHAAAEETIKVAIMNRSPFAWEENGVKRGFHYDLANLISHKAGFTPVIQLTPALRTFEFLKNHSADFVIFSNSPEFEELKTRRSPIIETETVLFSLAAHPLSNTHFENSVKMARLGKGCQDLRNDKNIQWIEAQSYEQAHQLLKAKRVQAVCGTTAFWFNVKSKKERAEISSYHLSKKEIFIHALPSMENEKWLRLETALKTLKKNGEIQQLFNHYLQDPPSKE